MSYAECAAQNFLNGCNCAQAVLLAFSDLTKLDPDTARRIASGFGGGMARMREVCGAVSGMFMAEGLLYGSSGLSHEEKAAHYVRLQALAAQFREKNGSILCRELLSGVKTDGSPLPQRRTAEYYQKRPCAQLVSDAAQILEAYIREHPLK